MMWKERKKGWLICFISSAYKTCTWVGIFLEWYLNIFLVLIVGTLNANKH